MKPSYECYLWLALGFVTLVFLMLAVVPSHAVVHCKHEGRVLVCSDD